MLSLLKGRAEASAPRRRSREPSSRDVRLTGHIQEKARMAISVIAGFTDPEEDRRALGAAYEQLRNEMLLALDEIDDPTCRGFATHQVIKAMMAAREKALAFALLVGVRDPVFREKIFATHPELDPETAS